MARYSKSDKLTRLIRGYFPTYKALSEVLGISSPTAKTRINDCDTLTVKELKKLCRSGHIPADEIREALEF